MMNTYYLRASSRAELVSACVAAGILTDDEQGTRPVSQRVMWDEIGEILQPTGEMNDGPYGPVPVMAPIADADGVPYWHANLYTPTDVTGIPPEYVLSPQPANPARVLWV